MKPLDRRPITCRAATGTPARASAAARALQRALGPVAVVVALGTIACGAPTPGTETPPLPPGPDEWHIEPVVFTDVQLTGTFWAPRMEINRTVTIPHLARQNEETGRIDNCRKSAGLMEGPFAGRRFNDSDVYKPIEAASYSLAQTYDPALDAELDELIELIAVPYFAWANRGPGEMAVWLPVAR